MVKHSFKLRVDFYLAIFIMTGNWFLHRIHMYVTQQGLVWSEVGGSALAGFWDNLKVCIIIVSVFWFVLKRISGVTASSCSLISLGLLVWENWFVSKEEVMVQKLELFYHELFVLQPRVPVQGLAHIVPPNEPDSQLPGGLNMTVSPGQDQQ